MTDDWCPLPEEFLCSTTTYGSTVTPTAVRSTGRGRKPGRYQSILKANLPELAIKQLGESKGRGRGRAKIFLKPELLESFKFDNNAHSGPDKYGSFGNWKLPPTGSSNVNNSNNSCITTISKEAGSSSLDTSHTQCLSEVLATAKERFEKYGVPKRNPALKSPDININSPEDFPCLPTQNFHYHSTPQPVVTCSDPEKILIENEKDQKSTHRSSSDDEVQEMYSLAAATPCDLPDTQDNEGQLMVSNPEQIEMDDDLSDNEADNKGVVRIENLPVGTKRSQLVEFVSTYGQVLDLNLQLKISDGEEKLSADVRLLDDSLAEFMASCLDGAEAAFEGIHSPLKCYKI